MANKRRADFTSGDSLFGAAKLTKNADFDKYRYSGYGIGFDVRGSYSLSIGNEFGINGIIFDADKSSSKHVGKRKEDILILCKVPIPRVR